MTLEETLVQRLIDEYGLKGKNIQGVLDNPLFKDLPLDKKVFFIKKFSESFKQEPTFNWSAIGKNTVLSAVGGVIAGTSAGLIARAAGGPGITPLGLKIGAILGGLAGAGTETVWQNKRYNNDLKTSKNIDDAIGTLVGRSQMAPNKPPPVPFLIKHIETLPGFTSAFEQSILRDQENYRNGKV